MALAHDQHPHFAAAAAAFSRVAAVAVIGMGAAVLMGWALDLWFLKNFGHRNRIAMNPATAVAFVVAGLSLWLSRPTHWGARHRAAAMACATVVTLVGAVKLIGIATGTDVLIDRLLFTDRLDVVVVSTANPGGALVRNVMAPNTALGFVLIGAALLLLDTRKLSSMVRPATLLALATLLLALTALTGYLYSVQTLYRVGPFIAMALNTAAAFGLLSLGVLAARPGRQPLATIVSRTAGGVVARRLLPAALLLPLLIGYLCLVGERAGIYESAEGVLIYSLAIILVFVALVWWNARFLYRLDLQRHRAEEALEDKHRLLRTLIDNLPDFIYVKDAQSRFLINNLAHVRGLGASSQEDVVGRTDRDFFEPELAARLREDELAVMRSGAPQISKEERLVRRDGTDDTASEPRWVTATKAPLRNAAGEVVGIVGISHDITNRKRMEDALRESEAHVRQIVETAYDAFVGMDDAGRITEWNRQAERTFGWTRAEAIGRTVEETIIPPRYRAAHAAGLAKFLKTGEGPVLNRRIEIEAVHRDGREFPIELTITPVRIAGDRWIFNAFVHDITERREAERLLRETNRQLEEAARQERESHAKLGETYAKLIHTHAALQETHEALKKAQGQLVQSEKLAGLGQMVAGVAHEINNPLSFVANNVAVLQRDLRGLADVIALYRKADEAIRAADASLLAQIDELSNRIDLAYTLENIDGLLARSREGLKRIQQIVKDLRDFARLDEGELQAADLNAGIESTINIIRGHAKKKRVTIETALAPLPPVPSHAAKLNQVVMNLLSNAIDASPEGGVVTVRSRASEPERTVWIEVEDRGTGIPPAVRARIFDPFFTTKKQGEGTGLGLSISYGIVQEHGGRIDVESEVGKGALFRVVLPIRSVGDFERRNR